MKKNQIYTCVQRTCRDLHRWSSIDSTYVAWGQSSAKSQYTTVWDLNNFYTHLFIAPTVRKFTMNKLVLRVIVSAAFAHWRTSLKTLPLYGYAFLMGIWCSVFNKIQDCTHTHSRAHSSAYRSVRQQSVMLHHEKRRSNAGSLLTAVHTPGKRRGKRRKAAGWSTVELRKYLTDVPQLMCRQTTCGCVWVAIKELSGRWENDTFGECESFVR